MGWLHNIFKKREAVPPPEPRPPAPCGNDKVHYEWTVDGIGIHKWKFPCPVCAALRARRIQREKDERQAELIATKVVEKLREFDINVTGDTNGTHTPD